MFATAAPQATAISSTSEGERGRRFGPAAHMVRLEGLVPLTRAGVVSSDLALRCLSHCVFLTSGARPSEGWPRRSHVKGTCPKVTRRCWPIGPCAHGCDRHPERMADDPAIIGGPTPIPAPRPGETFRWKVRDGRAEKHVYVQIADYLSAESFEEPLRSGIASKGESVLRGCSRAGRPDADQDHLGRDHRSGHRSPFAPLLDLISAPPRRPPPGRLL